MRLVGLLVQNSRNSSHELIISFIGWDMGIISFDGVSAAEQKARTTYDNILRLVHDSDVCEPIKFLRAREIVHFQRFGEALRDVQDHLDSRNFYAFNPEFDMPSDCGCR